jgi:hypothetical protein
MNDGLVKSLFTGHCEERSDEAISWFQAVTANEIAFAMTPPASFYETINE